MININLLPEKQKLRVSPKIKREVIYYVVIVCVVVVAVFFIHRFINNKIMSLEYKVQKKEISLKKCQRKVKRIAILKRKLKEIQRKINIIKNIRKAQVMPLVRLDLIEALIPYQKLWFKKLSLKGADLSLQGTALDNQALAFYIQKLRKSGYIKNVIFNKAERKYISYFKLVDFNCEIKFTQGMP